MRLRSILAALAAGAAFGAGPALAGAWPREPGAVFLSARGDFGPTAAGRSPGGSLYGEYGLTRRITLIGQFSNADSPWANARAGVAVQYALSKPEARHKLAVGFGVSAPPSMMGAMLDARIETSLHWGMGFESRFGGGWATLSAKFIQPMAEEAVVTDLHGLVGVRPREGWMTMLAANRYEDGEGVTWKLSPSVGYQVTEKITLVPNVTRQIGGAGETTVGLSIWLSF